MNSMPTEVSLSVHVVGSAGVYLLNADLLSDWHGRGLCRVCGVEGLVIGEPIQVLVVLLKHFLIVFAIRICFKVMEKAE